MGADVALKNKVSSIHLRPRGRIVVVADGEIDSLAILELSFELETVALINA